MTAPDNDPARLGGRLGTRLAEMLSRATVATRAQTGPLQAGVAQLVMRDFTNHVSDEIRSVMGPLWREAVNDPNVPEDVKPLLRALGNMRGQAWAWIGGTATGAALGAGVLDMLNNALAPFTTRVIGKDPNMPVAIADVVRAEVAGLRFADGNVREASWTGINEPRFRTLVEAARPLPTVDELRFMLLRGDIDGPTAGAALGRLGYADRWHADMLNLRFSEGTPEEIAAMWNRGIIDEREAIELGQRGGALSPRMRRMLELGGDPPGLQELLFAWRRGIIDESRVDRGIKQSPLRFEWADVAKALREIPLAAEEAASAVTQGHLTLQEGAARAWLSGVTPEDFDVLVANAGLPPGLDFAAEAFNRGLLSEEDWTSMFLESRIKNKYIPLMRVMRQAQIPTETTRLLYRHGVYSRESAIATLKGHGYSDVDAEAQLALEDLRADDGTKELTRAQVLDLFEDEIITRDAALEMLRSVGYGAAEAEWLMQLREVDMLRKFVNASVGRVRTSYVARRIDEAEATHLLDELGVGAAHRDRLLSLWAIEQEAVVATLTPSQIQQAVRKGFMGTEAALARLVFERRYSPEDARVLIQLAGADVPIEGGE